MKNILKYLDSIQYWSIVLLPFSIAISAATMNAFMAILIVSFIAEKLIPENGCPKSGRHLVTTHTAAIAIPFLVLFLITCVSLVHTVSLKDSIRGGVLRLAQYALIILITAEKTRDKAHIKKIIISIALGLSFTAVNEIWQVIMGKDFMRGYPAVVNIGIIRATASFKDPNTLGIYLSAIFPLIYGLTLYRLKNMKRSLFILISILGGIGVLLTYSRPTLLAVYIAVFYLACAKKDKLMISFLTAFLFISPFIAPQSVKNWAKEVEYNPLRFMCNDDRIAVYRHTLNMIKAHPLIGVGANTYMSNYKKYKEFPEYRKVKTPDYMYAHNTYLHMAAEIGILGLCAFFWFIYVFFKQCANANLALTDPFLKTVHLSLTACAIAFLINGLTESSLQSSRGALIFWYLLGLSTAFIKFKPTYANKQ